MILLMPVWLMLSSKPTAKKADDGYVAFQSITVVSKDVRNAKFGWPQQSCANRNISTSRISRPAPGFWLNFWNLRLGSRPSKTNVTAMMRLGGYGNRLV